MKSARIGNPIVVKWVFKHTDGTPFPLAEYTPELFYYTGRGKSQATDFSIIGESGNILVWNFNPSVPFPTGEYSLQLKAYHQGALISTFMQANAFMLTNNGDVSATPVTVQLTSFCDYIPFEEAVQQMRHVTDAAVAATNEAIEAAAEITYIPLLTSAGLAPYVGQTRPIAGLYSLLSIDTLSQIVEGIIRRVKIDDDIYAVTQAGLINNGYTFTLSSITFGDPMDGQDTPPYVFVVNPEAGFFTLTKYSF